MESSKLECPRPGTGNPQAEPMTNISAIQENNASALPEFRQTAVLLSLFVSKPEPSQKACVAMILDVVRRLLITADLEGCGLTRR